MPALQNLLKVMGSATGYESTTPRRSLCLFVRLKLEETNKAINLAKMYKHSTHSSGRGRVHMKSVC